MKGANHGTLDGGYVYIMSNPSMSGYYKLGQTQDLERRRLELSKVTSAPLPFKCEFALFTPEYVRLERAAHQKLERHRIKGKEFFTCDLSTIIREVQKAYLEITTVNLDEKIPNTLLKSTQSLENFSETAQLHQALTHKGFQTRSPKLLPPTALVDEEIEDVLERNISQKHGGKAQNKELLMDIVKASGNRKNPGLLSGHLYLVETTNPRESEFKKKVNFHNISDKALDKELNVYFEILRKHQTKFQFVEGTSIG